MEVHAQNDGSVYLLTIILDGLKMIVEVLLKRRLAAKLYLFRLDGLPLTPGSVCQRAAIFVGAVLPVLDSIPCRVHRTVVDFVLFHDLPAYLLSIVNGGGTRGQRRMM